MPLAETVGTPTVETPAAVPVQIPPEATAVPGVMAAAPLAVPVALLSAATVATPTAATAPKGEQRHWRHRWQRHRR
ncbi:MAG: hypothetical protein LC721_12375 [Actinobacteria bacterium]|nr:hypothetical protein [Actinomycetota bacterium]